MAWFRAGHREYMVASREEVLDYIRSSRSRLRRRYRIRRIALIGSFARGEQTAESDIDFLVDIEENTPDLYELKRELRREMEEKLGRPVEIASERYLKPYYRAEILRDAIYVE